jgi:DNA-binding PadR family transcriptional regulator
MKVPIYILGFLMRYGALHGYKLKRLISERASDFAHIKLPTLYYHLEKLQKAGFVTAKIEKKGRRPDRMVYTITKSGRVQFEDMLREMLHVWYQTEFALDAALFFGEALESTEMPDALRDHERHLKEALVYMKEHRKQVLAVVQENAKRATEAIFNHHLVHYEAELKWVKETLTQMMG